MKIEIVQAVLKYHRDKELLRIEYEESLSDLYDRLEIFCGKHNVSLREALKEAEKYYGLKSPL